jgi:hypothetical protein
MEPWTWKEEKYAGNNWIHLVQERDQRRALVGTIVNIQVL